MEFKDYYATLGLKPAATQAEIKRAYRKLARKFHPDVSKEPDAEARFKEVAEAHEALIDPERRAAYDDMARRRANGEASGAPPGWDGGFEYSGRGGDGTAGADNAEFSEFFESLFGRGRGRGGGGGEGMRRHPRGNRATQGEDHHARLTIDLVDSYRGTQRTLSLRMPIVDAQGQVTLRDHQLAVTIPRGVRPGQQLRLVGQGSAGQGGGTAGDLYLEIEIAPDPVFRLEGRDVHFELAVAPWEASLGATVETPTPEGPVQLSVPPGSRQGRRLRLKGRGLPGTPAGDLYAVLVIAVPPAASEPEKAAWQALAQAYGDFNPRAVTKG